MSKINTVIVSGYLGKDPTIRRLSSGVMKAELSVGVNRPRSANSDVDPPCDWIECELWEGQAEAASRLLSCGSHVMVQGALRTDKWVASDGTKRFKLYVRGRRFDLLGQPSGARRAESPPASPPPTTGQSPYNVAPPPAQYAGEPGHASDDIPF